MRYIKILTILSLTATMLLQSCDESFLELDQPIYPALETYYTDSATAFEGLVGCYNSFTNYNTGESTLRYIWHLDIRSDDTDYAGNPRGVVEEQNYYIASGFSNFDILADNTHAYGVWEYCYNGVNTINKYLEGMNSTSFPVSQQPLVEQYKAEAKVIRSYFYFLLVKNFGPVVLYTNSLSQDEWYSQSRQEESLVYAQIFKDLREAKELLPLRSDYGDAMYGRITKAAAQTLLAKALITEAEIDGSSPNWQEAYDLCREVELSGEYNLNTLHEDMWKVAGQFSSEFILDIIVDEAFDSEKDSYIHGLSPRYYFDANGVPKHDRKLEFGFGISGITEDMANQYGYYQGYDSLQWVNLTDSRGKITFWTRWERYTDEQYIIVDELTSRPETTNPHATDDANYYQQKYSREKLGVNYWSAGSNLHLIRYAETLLIAAEAAYYLGNEEEARRLVNMIRERAFRPAINDGRTTLAEVEINSSGKQLLEDIWQERRLELAGEADRFHDLKRTHRLHILKEKKPEILFQEGKHELLPIPASELALAPNLTQNPGY